MEAATFPSLNAAWAFLVHEACGETGCQIPTHALDPVPMHRLNHAEMALDFYLRQGETLEDLLLRASWESCAYPESYMRRNLYEVLTIIWFGPAENSQC